MGLQASVVVSWYIALTFVRGQLVEDGMTQQLTECMHLIGNHNDSLNVTNIASEDIHSQCLQHFLWKTENVQWSNFNITQKETQFINSLIGSLVHHGRRKRQTGSGGGPMHARSIFPPTGFRIRREYRRLSDRERSAFHAAINRMKIMGQYDTFANLHQGMVVTSAHGGPNFLGWHRVYLAIVEEALRRINPILSLPYWDSTLDFDMEDPTTSIIWSARFLGNGDGFVTSGPFANWMTPIGQLTRNIGSGSRLFSKDIIRAVLTRCRIRDISEPTAQVEFNLELAHGGPHVWVGGLMSGLNTAAHDPAFFLHHAFVDYIWEIFRLRQARFCGVNPSRDYPPTVGEHSAQRRMDGFPQYRNIEGYRDYWTQFWYRYERSPTCSRWRPYCASPYLRCDMMQQRCVSVSGMVPGSGRAVFDGVRMSVASVERARAQESTIDIGPRFRAPPAEIRTQAAQIAISRMRFPGGTRLAFAEAMPGSLASAVRARAHDATVFIGPRFVAPPQERRTQDAQFGMSFGRM